MAWNENRVGVTKTNYKRVGNKWVPCGSATTTSDYGIVMDNYKYRYGLPFEKSHKYELKHPYRHNHPFDRFSTISPDGRDKSVYDYDFISYDNPKLRK